MNAAAPTLPEMNCDPLDANFVFVERTLENGFMEGDFNEGFKKFVNEELKGKTIYDLPASEIYKYANTYRRTLENPKSKPEQEQSGPVPPPPVSVSANANPGPKRLPAVEEIYNTVDKLLVKQDGDLLKTVAIALNAMRTTEEGFMQSVHILNHIQFVDHELYTRIKSAIAPMTNAEKSELLETIPQDETHVTGQPNANGASSTLSSPNAATPTSSKLWSNTASSSSPLSSPGSRLGNSMPATPTGNVQSSLTTLQQRGGSQRYARK